MPAYGKPSIQYIKDAVAEAKIRFRGRNDRIANARLHRLQLREPNYPGSSSSMNTSGPRLHDETSPAARKPLSGGPFRDYLQPHHSPISRDLLRRGQSVLSVELPDPSVPPTNRADPKSRAAAAKMQRFLKQAYPRMSRARNGLQGGSTWFKITDADPCDGEAVWKILPRTDLWIVDQGEGEPDQAYLRRLESTKRTRFPIVWDYVETMNYYPITGDMDGLADIVEVSRVSLNTLATEFGLVHERGTLRSIGRTLGPAADVSDVTIPDLTGNEAELWQYHNRDTIVYLIEGVEIKTIIHEYLRVPYFHVYFSPNSMSDPKYATEGLADPIFSLQDDIEDITTAQKTWFAISSYPPAKLTPQNEMAEIADGPGGGIQQDVEWGPGLTAKPPAGFSWGFESPPPLGQDGAALREYLLQQIQDIGLAGILKGLADASRLSGPAALQLVQIARSVFAPAVEEIKAAFDESGAFILYLIENVIGQEVPIRYTADAKEGIFDHDDLPEGAYISLGPEDIRGWYVVDHQMAPLSLLERQAKIMVLTNGMEQGLISPNRVREEGYGIHDPVSEDIEVKIAKILDSNQNLQDLYKHVQEIIEPGSILQEVQAFLVSMGMNPQVAAQDAAGTGAAGTTSPEPAGPDQAPESAPPSVPSGPGVMRLSGMGGQPPMPGIS